MLEKNVCLFISYQLTTHIHRKRELILINTHDVVRVNIENTISRYSSNINHRLVTLARQNLHGLVHTDAKTN